MKLQNQRGFTIIEGLIGVLVLGLVIFAVVNYMNQREARESNNNDTTTQQDSVPEVNNAGDLETVEETLEQADVDSLESDELNTSVDELY